MLGNICRSSKGLWYNETWNSSIKTDHYGVRGVTNNWFKSYLTDRKQCVSINGYNNSFFYCIWCSTGIWFPMFLLYINNLHRAIKFCKVHHFVHDTKRVFLTASMKKLNKLMNTEKFD